MVANGRQHRTRPGFLCLATSRLGSNCHVIDRGGRAVLIDAGHPRTVEQTLQALGDAGVLGRLQAVILTHSHADHVGAAGALQSRGVEVWAGSAEPSRRLLAQERDLGLVPEPYRVDRVLADGERIVLGDETIRIVATPGHSDDHICVLLEQSRTLFAGDLFTYEDVGTFDINHHHAVSLQTMLATIDRCAALRPLCVAPGHGRPVRNPGRLFETAAKRMKLFARSPSIMVAHTLMPLVMLLIEARGVADIEDIRRHTREHAPLFEDFLAGAVSIEDELDRILLVLAMKGVVAIDGTRVFLRADALAQAA